MLHKHESFLRPICLVQTIGTLYSEGAGMLPSLCNARIMLYLVVWEQQDSTYCDKGLTGIGNGFYVVKVCPI